MGCIFLPAGDCALTVEFGREISDKLNDQVRAMSDALKCANIPGVMEWVPTFRSLTIYYDPSRLSYGRLKRKVLGLARSLTSVENQMRRVIEIPVCYGGAYGEDLPDVAACTGLSVDEVVSRHCAGKYRIYMLGFLPGFAYMGGLDPALHTPRLKTPRTKIPAGSVGIGGEQTGIYPMASPGGWRLIGMTPIKPYDPARQTPILFMPGDFVRFVTVGEEEFRSIRVQAEAGEYQCREYQEVRP